MTEAAAIGGATVAKSPATYRDVLDAPEHLVAEIVRGELVLSPRPAIPHTAAASVLGMVLGGPFHLGSGGPGGWQILYEPELHLGADVLVPDLAGWRRDRMPRRPRAAAIDLPPDWVCEVLSPGSRTRDLTDKRAIYGEHGVEHLWFVDPHERLLEAFALVDRRWTLIAALRDAAEVRVAPFDAVAFPLAALWPEEPDDGGVD